MLFEKGPQNKNNQKQTEKTPTQRMKKAVRSEKNERRCFTMFIRTETYIVYIHESL